MRATTLVLIATFAAQAALGAAPAPKTYATPEAAEQALVKAVQSKNQKNVLAVLGPAAGPLINSGDPIADKNARDTFVEAYKASHSLDKSVDGKVTIEVGDDKWPFPIPIVMKDGKWSFDSVAGAEELINRRVGANELSTIQSSLAFVDAEREYYQRNVEKDPLQHYAGKLISSDGKKDGLYWPSTNPDDQSPMGEEFAKARAEGYLQTGAPRPEPFHGYVYRMLTSQGANAHGGAYDYMVNGKLFGGFALIAFPAEYGNSGVMTFIVNHDGVVFSRDLGPDTEKAALAIKEFDPDSNWKKEEGADAVAAQ